LLVEIEQVVRGRDDVGVVACGDDRGAVVVCGVLEQPDDRAAGELVEMRCRLVGEQE
jgi:hypothetical protein